MPHLIDAALVCVGKENFSTAAQIMFPKLGASERERDERVHLCVVARALSMELCQPLDLESHVMRVSSMLIANNITSSASGEFWNALMGLETSLLEMALQKKT